MTEGHRHFDVSDAGKEHAFANDVFGEQNVHRWQQQRPSGRRR